jgi:hypothetical protein
MAHHALQTNVMALSPHPCFQVFHEDTRDAFDYIATTLRHMHLKTVYQNIDAYL